MDRIEGTLPHPEYPAHPCSIKHVPTVMNAAWTRQWSLIRHYTPATCCWERSVWVLSGWFAETLAGRGTSTVRQVLPATSIDPADRLGV